MSCDQTAVAAQPSIEYAFGRMPGRVSENHLQTIRDRDSRAVLKLWTNWRAPADLRLAVQGGYRQALELLRQVRPNVLAGARAELDYVIFKTGNFAGYLDVLAAGYEAVAACDRAVLVKNNGDRPEMLKQLDAAQTAIDRADRLAREVARQMIPFASIPTEKYLLFRFNQNVIGWTEKGRAELAKVLASVKQPNRQPKSRRTRIGSKGSVL
ncbi:MAG: hypothetical protein FJ388_03175 [Verrucomicrobia bacterium]|nr:hypothetical protein [Verrucomicrobiota bacterium]